MTDFFRSSRSLRRVLILPYACLVFVLATGIGFLSYRAGSRAVENVTDHLLQETIGQIEQAVEHHIAGSKAVLEVAFPRGMPAPADIGSDRDGLRQRFWVATSLYPDPNNFVYYGNQGGQDLGVFRLSPLEAQLRIKLKATEYRRYYNFQGMSGELKPGALESALFDPRVRPWYLAAQATDKDIWTPVYIDFGKRDLVITRARRVLSADGTFAGVVATDVSLKALNDYVLQLKPSQNGLAFVMDQDGSVIAASVGGNLRLSRHGEIQRQYASSDQDAMLRATYAALKNRMAADKALVSSGKTFIFDAPGGQTMHAAYDWIRDDAGLEWIVVVAIPRSDFMGDVINNAALTGLAGALAVALSIVLGLLIVNWVVKDIGHLSDITSKIGQGDLQAHIAIDRRDEIGQLAMSIELMQSSLSTDKLTGLTSRAALIRHVESGIERNRNAGAAAAGFAVLFIDLDHFKPINDQYGHQLGDRTLIEIAGRLQKSIRQGDVAARYGGDEFVIVLWQIKNIENVKKIIANLNQLLSQPLQCFEDLELGRKIQVSASIGVALYPTDGEDAEILIRKADQKMYEEKSLHRI